MFVTQVLVEMERTTRLNFQNAKVFDLIDTKGHVLGSRLIDLQPEQDGCDEGDCRQEYLWASVVSGCDPSPVFQAAKHYLDAVASFIATLVIFDGLGARLSSRDAGLYSLIYKGLPEPIRVISSVS